MLTLRTVPLHSTLHPKGNTAKEPELVFVGQYQTFCSHSRWVVIPGHSSGTLTARSPPAMNPSLQKPPFGDMLVTRQVDEW